MKDYHYPVTSRGETFYLTPHDYENIKKELKRTITKIKPKTETKKTKKNKKRKVKIIKKK